MSQLDAGVPNDQISPVACKRKDILKLPLNEYKKWAPEAKSGYKKVARFLTVQKIFSDRYLPYSDQIIPLAAVFAILGEKADTEGVMAKIARWYWCGVLGELYGSATESRFAKDVPELLQWIDGGNPPSTVAEANFVPARLFSLRLRLSAAYKGL